MPISAFWVENAPRDPHMGSPDESVHQHGDAPREAQSSARAPEEMTPASQLPDPFWARTKRHKVVEWALAYVALGYALLHGVQMLREAFGWPFLAYRLTAVGLLRNRCATSKKSVK